MSQKNSNDCVFLSHPWGPSCPPYGGGDSVTLTSSKQISRGDSCNSLWMSAPNHIGTHMDFPLHFCSGGKTALDYTANEFVFYRPVVIDLGMLPYGTLVTPSHVDKVLQSATEQVLNADLVLIKTNASKYRTLQEYWQNGPGLAPGLAAHLRTFFPNHRAIGIDAISITSFSQREIGREVHREFLGQNNPVILIEDMDMSALDWFQPEIITALPLRIEAGDGAPATVIASRKRTE